ncbi:MAG: hypothetical protein ACTSSB_11320 [Candidatus Heimdallarchaeota archaeon]
MRKSKKKIFLSPFLEDDRIYISANDVIKNFKFDSFDGEPITTSGTVPSLGSRLNFESGLWTTNPDDLEIITLYQVGDVVYIGYVITLTNKFNIYTNVRLDDASEKPIEKVEESFLAGEYEHLGLFGHHLWGFESDIDWSHYDFGNVINHNADHNKFSGDLQMSFDIDPSPLPSTLVDQDGNPANKQYDYIGVDAVYVGDVSRGTLSNDMPEVEGLTPLEYQSNTENSKSGGDTSGTMYYKYTWNPNTQLSPAFRSTTVDFGVISQSSGSSLNPTQKNGEALWDPEVREESMASCEFHYSLGSISPIVYEYSSRMTWNEQSIQTQDEYGLFFSIHQKLNFNRDITKTETRPVALHVKNRYIQFEVKIPMKIWCAFEIETLNDDDYDGLEQPAEYYDDLLWTSVVDGFGGGSVISQQASNGIIITIVIIIILIVAVAFIWKFGSQFILYKALTRKNKR